MEALLQYRAANAALCAATEELGPQKVIARDDLERWKALDAKADAAHEVLRRARARVWEHRATHPATR